MCNNTRLNYSKIIVFREVLYVYLLKLHYNNNIVQANKHLALWYACRRASCSYNTYTNLTLNNHHILMNLEKFFPVQYTYMCTYETEKYHRRARILIIIDFI